MGFLDRFEKGVENVAGRAMSHFSNDVEPIEIASKLRETMDKRAASFARDRSVVPNVFRVHLAPSDVERIDAWGHDEMVRQMAEVVTSHAAEQGYSFVGPVEVSFLPDQALSAPAIEIDSSTRRGAAAPAAAAAPTPSSPVLDIDGQRYLLTGPVTVIGRGSEADIIVDDSGVSRRHLEIRLTQGHAIATDLGSTNGTFVEGHRVDAATLLDGNTLTVGRTRIMFWDGTHGPEAHG
ncbi:MULTISPECIES: DUF3662 and FHA domain-containing protein [unclassified Actinomyces]|uniref:FhaA domain-containing protein n=1 Tax=unclassified Actinomyces TaxID=2609248 RepID=UPI002016BA10|nr:MULTISPECIES: DUF3662 and FHA domain-containing protein [unclassified Actinomyces]MCL3777350.1 DUF3662 domain-containing protein [Actinomyces sp. AC-20-1]MCL3790681.1 DUF3662 domain-containing protein [Actinomyces sp. 187325]MCL3792984.1 DUF3662 domain-containing protein [Actinomyces sp. 186855]MCL3793487.1 DUF3662 domain-containing protein [Actinomyces sp. 217892]